MWDGESLKNFSLDLSDGENIHVGWRKFENFSFDLSDGENIHVGWRKSEEFFT